MTPQKTIERLIVYRIILAKMQAQGIINTFSKDLAEQSGCTSVQVRRDLMFVGYSGNPQNGYVVKLLHDKIKLILDPEPGISMAIIGIGNLGRAILGYFNRLEPHFKLIAAFDTDEQKINRVIAGCRCYHIREINTILQPLSVLLGIITVPINHAQEAANLLITAGVKGIVNFTPLPIKAPENVFVENIDITQTFQKVAYFARLQNRGGIS